MGSGSLAKRTIYSCRAHIATSFVPVVRVIGREIFIGDLEILGEQGSQFKTSKLQVSCLIVLHRIRVSIFGQGLYGGSYRRFCGCGPPSAQVIGKYTCMGVLLFCGYPLMGVP
jgi:hypothetical protein